MSIVPTTTLRRVLVANRGEIARRVQATCRRLGIETVAVHSDVDANAPFVHEADVAVAIGGAAPADSYLRADAVIEAARRTGADAIHPGYGFLSEDPAFARAVIDAGLVWIGPAPEVMAEMGSKLRARERMAAAGVPVLPGGLVADDVTPDALAAQAAEVGFPLLVKASAGGGGRGMRRVQAEGELVGAVDAARHEARAAFGDGTVFLERFVQRPRHVEVQILGDAHGTVSALPERDCTIQRRHQKLLEESPAPAIDGAVRERLASAARAAGRDLGYVGAGTVEFVLSPEGEIFFLEVNARLQVEHPVTEAVCGLDLVALQIAVAEGAPLPAEAVDPAPRGHAIEARLVAEDPAAGWLPRTGTVEHFAIESDAAFAVPRAAPGTTTLRVDAGVRNGSTIGPHYDSLVAKVIAHGPDRTTAVRRLATALRRARLAGPTTARDLLVRTLESEAFATVAHDTQLLDGDALAGLAAPLAGEADVRRGAAAAAFATAAANREAAPVLRDVRSGFRTVGRAPQVVSFSRHDAADDGDLLRVAYRLGRRGALEHLEVGGTPLALGDVALRPTRRGDGVLVDLVQDGVRRTLTVRRAGALLWVSDGRCEVRLRELPRFRDPEVAGATGSLVAPLPGGVLRVLVAPGDEVRAGQPLVVLEAMKMEHEVSAGAAGVVTAVHVQAGGQVAAGAPLVAVEAPEA